MSDYEDDDKEKKSVVFFHLKGNDIQLNAKLIAEIKKSSFLDANSNIVYTITVSKYFGEDVVVPYFEQDVRDKEHLNLLSKMEEQGIILL